MKRKGLGFYLRIYCKILAQDIKSKMSYRADFIISTIGMIFTNIAGFVSFWILFRSFPSINGWSYHEMLFLCIRAILSSTVSVLSICFSITSPRYSTSRDWDSLHSVSER